MAELQAGSINPYFDSPYGKASVSITTGNTIIATTGGYYMGCAIISTVPSTLIVYDNASTASGNILDVFAVIATTVGRQNLIQTLMVKNGFSVNLTGAGAKAVIFYAPKG